LLFSKKTNVLAKEKTNVLAKENQCSEKIHFASKIVKFKKIQDYNYDAVFCPLIYGAILYLNMSSTVKGKKRKYEEINSTICLVAFWFTTDQIKDSISILSANDFWTLDPYDKETNSTLLRHLEDSFIRKCKANEYIAYKVKKSNMSVLTHCNLRATKSFSGNLIFLWSSVRV
jgi:hypothetical protein